MLDVLPDQEASTTDVALHVTMRTRWNEINGLQLQLT